MKDIEVLVLNNNKISIVNKIYDWLTPFGQFILEDSSPSIYRAQNEQIIFKDAATNKFLVTIPLDSSKILFEEALKKALGGYFDNVPNDQIGTYKGGNTSLDSSWINIGIPFDVPDLGVGDILDKLFDALGLGKIAWIPYAAGATILSVKAATSKKLLWQSLFGAASVYLGYKTYKKFKS